MNIVQFILVSHSHDLFGSLREFDTVFPFPPTPRIQPDGYSWMTDEQVSDSTQLILPKMLHCMILR